MSMILLRANSEIRAVFHKLIKTMGEDIAWTEIFMITNNDIILAGKEKSLFFNFDNKSTFCNYIDITIEESRVDQIVKGTLLENTLNMLLYAFGKWGGIKGLTVEMNYEQLNNLLNKLLAEVDIEVSLTQDYFRFYKEGMTLTYEDVIQAILNQSKGEDQNKDNEHSDDDEQSVKPSDYSIGLWHKIQWESGKFVFEKERLTEADRRKDRIGNNFYRVGYHCPNCKDKLHMVVYPQGSEYRIETDEEAVYLARAYTCNQCNSFYTPKPQRLLMEGEVYSLNFEEDKVAYFDYLELLGDTGARTFNGHFNEYQSVYLKNEKQENDSSLQLEEQMTNIQTISDQDIVEIKDKMGAGFYPALQVKKHYRAVNKEIRRRMRIRKDSPREESRSNSYADNKNYTMGESEILSKSISQKRPVKNHAQGIKIKKYRKKNTNGLKEEITYKIDSVSKTKNPQKKQEFITKKKDKAVSKESEVIELNNVIESAKDKSYVEIVRLIEKIKTEENINNSVKSTDNRMASLEEMEQILHKQGEIEVKNILRNIPNEVSKQKYHLYKEKIEQYKEIDTSNYLDILKKKRDATEKQEIAAFIKKQNPVNRTTYYNTYHKLKEQDFDKDNVQIYLDKIYDKVQEYDRREIQKICPDPAEVTYKEGLQVYEEISKGDYLPELKVNVLGLLDKRLSRLKMDECELLVNKLRKKMNWSQEDYSRVYLYDARKNNTIIQNALNTYASARGRYEYPIMICDDSLKENGKTGFLLTPDHVYFNSIASSGYMKIEDITKLTIGKGVFKNKIYAQHVKKSTIKISNNLKIKQVESWVNVLNEYLLYLQEKPESRDISYLAKEKHEVICCYRCGYTYRVGNICPRCGLTIRDGG